MSAHVTLVTSTCQEIDSSRGERPDRKRRWYSCSLKWSTKHSDKGEGREQVVDFVLPHQPLPCPSPLGNKNGKGSVSLSHDSECGGEHVCDLVFNGCRTNTEVGQCDSSFSAHAGRGDGDTFRRPSSACAIPVVYVLMRHFVANQVGHEHDERYNQQDEGQREDVSGFACVVALARG